MDSFLLSRTPSSSSDSSFGSMASGNATPDTAKCLLHTAEQSFALTEQTSLNDFILIVGGLGFIGSHTAWELLKAERSVIIIDNLVNSFRSVLEKLETLCKIRYRGQLNAPTLHFYEADYTDDTTICTILSKYERKEGSIEVQPTVQPSAHSQAVNLCKTRTSSISKVIHFAAYKSVAGSFRDPLAYYSNNVSGVISFCKVLSQFNIKKLVFSSSATVYGALANQVARLPEECCIHEVSRQWIDEHGSDQLTWGGCTGLTNPYGRTKWICESFLHDLAVSNPEWRIVALRYFNPIGCDESGLLGEDPKATPNNLMPIVVKAMTGEFESLEVFGTDWPTRDGTAIRDFIHVSDLARGHLFALKATEYANEGGHLQIFNLGTGTGHSVAEVVSAMERVSGRQISVQHVERREGDVAMCIAEPSKSWSELGWKTEKTLDDCCRDICRFLGMDVAEKRN